MTMVIIIVITIIIIALAGWFSIVRQKKANKRRLDLAAWAQSKGLSIRNENDSRIGSRYFLFNCLQQGDHRYAFNITEGPIGNRKLCAFDYHYETHTRDSKGHEQTSHHYFSAVVVETDMRLKPLFIRAENIFDKVKEAVGFNDINFESTEFNKKFYVKAPDKKWAYDVINQKNMELLLNSCHFHVEFNGNAVIAYRNTTFAPAYFEESLRLVTGILDNMPESLILECKGVR